MNRKTTITGVASNTSRRQFLKLIGAASLAPLAQALPLTSEKSLSDKPNIVMIFSDSHRADVMGCYGNKIVNTPNFDNLAREGVLFENCYCNSPLCGPSRLSFTAGKYSSQVNVWNLWYGLPENEDFPTLPRIMNTAGYESYFCGHMDFPPTNSYGFNMLGKWPGRVKDKTGRRRKPDDLETKPGYSNRFDGSYVGDKSGVISHDKTITRTGLDFLENYKNPDKPFFLLLGYSAPHFPFTAPEKYYNKYKGKVPMPQIPEGHIESQPLNYKHLRTAFHFENLPDEITIKSRELYYALTEWFDNELGKFLKALKDSQFSDNTVVIYSSDHAENLGEHGLWWKNAMYDSATHVPLIAHWPSKWKGGQRRKGACSLLDVAKTIADIGGAKIPSDWNGDSLEPWIADPNYKWKDLAVSEYYAHYVASGYAMIRMGKYKYTYHTSADEEHPPQRELYDIEADPKEMSNLADNTAYKPLMQRMHAALVKEVGEEPGKTELRCRADYDNANG